MPLRNRIPFTRKMSLAFVEINVSNHLWKTASSRGSSKTRDIEVIAVSWGANAVG